MSKYIKVFQSHTEYEAYADGDMLLPNVSHCVSEHEVHYNPWVERPFFCKLTLNNDDVVELEGSGELTSAMISSYKSTLVSAEIGELCTSIGGYVFLNCTSLASVTIQNSVTSIGYQAFQNCQSLRSVTIPDNVTNIGGNAFAYCTGLTSITIPNSVTSISSGAFANCSNLASVTIGSSVTMIGQQTFLNGSSLASITSLATTAPTIYDDTFKKVKTNGTLTVPSGSNYSTWMGTGDYYLGKYNWTKVEQ